MFLQLAHTRLNVYDSAQQLILECYRLTKLLPADERFNMVQQIRRAALSVNLNIAEGCSRKSQVERNRFFEIARGSVIEIDTAIDVAVKLSYLSSEQLQTFGDLIVKNFKLITGMISRETTHN